MNNKRRKWVTIGAAIFLILAFAVVACKNQSFTAQGVTNYNELHLSANSATGTPALMVDQAGAGVLFEVRDASTPVYEILDGGSVSQTGDQAFTGNLVVSAPTAATTATPAVVINSLAAGANLLEVRDASTPVFVVENGGDHTIAGNVAVAGPTAAATATPMIYANTAADAPNLMVIAKDATPVVYVHNAGMLDVGGGTGGTADGVGDLLVAGDAEVDDTLDVDGDIDLNGDGFDVDITAGFSVDGDAASNVSVAGAGIDLTLEAEAGEVHIKSDEATATGITLDADEAAGTGVTIAVGASGGLNINGGLTDIGGGSGQTADGDNDLLVAGDLEVDTSIDLDGSLAIEGAVTLTQTNAAGGSANPIDYTATAGIMDGSDDLTIIDINLTNADHTGASNTVKAIDIGNITGDADATETAILVGTGWDLGLDLSGTCVDLDSANTTSICADTDNTIDIEVNGADDFQITANTFTALAGSTIAADTINDTSSGGLSVTADVDVSGSLQYGASNLYPLGYATSGYQVVYGTATMTTTAVAAHGLTTVTWALCTLGEDPETGAGDAAACTVAISANVVTVKTWQDDFTAATEADVVVHWMVIGLP